MTIRDQAVIVLGAGGHAKVVADVLVLSGYKIIGIVDPDKRVGTQCFGFKVIGNDDFLESYPDRQVLLANGIGCLPGDKLRWNIAKKMRGMGYAFVNVIHPSVVIADDVVLGEGVQVMAGSIIQPGTSVGRDTIINTAARVDHDCHISENCHLSPGVTLSGGINVGEGTHLGTGTIVIQNISIGSNCVIAAGSVVYKNIQNSSTLIQSKQNTFKSEGI